jgi:hypothetical protein
MCDQCEPYRSSGGGFRGGSIPANLPSTSRVIDPSYLQNDVDDASMWREIRDRAWGLLARVHGLDDASWYVHPRVFALMRRMGQRDSVGYATGIDFLAYTHGAESVLLTLFGIKVTRSSQHGDISLVIPA